jgi:hypothetical protein
VPSEEFDSQALSDCDSSATSLVALPSERIHRRHGGLLCTVAKGSAFLPRVLQSANLGQDSGVAAGSRSTFPLSQIFAV